MFKLPVCPYCSTIYRYNDVKKTISEKKHTCYHCKKDFIVSKKQIFILLLIIILLASVLNIFELYVMPSLNIALLIGTNIIVVLIGILFIPFFIKFKKCNDSKK